MRIWGGFGTEHSMNLVMIGHFEDAASAAHATELIGRFTDAAVAEEAAGRLHAGEYSDRYTEEILDLLSDSNVHSVEPNELQQFLYDTKVSQDDLDVVITTDEIDIQAYMKILLARGARIEVYSAHEHKGTGRGRAT